MIAWPGPESCLHLLLSMLFSASIAEPLRKTESTGRSTAMLAPALTSGAVLTTGGGVLPTGGSVSTIRGAGADPGDSFSHPMLTNKMITGMNGLNFFINVSFN